MILRHKSRALIAIEEKYQSNQPCMARLPAFEVSGHIKQINQPTQSARGGGAGDGLLLLLDGCSYLMIVSSRRSGGEPVLADRPKLKDLSIYSRNRNETVNCLLLASGHQLSLSCRQSTWRALKFHCSHDTGSSCSRHLLQIN